MLQEGGVFAGETLANVVPAGRVYNRKKGEVRCACIVHQQQQHDMYKLASALQPEEFT